MSKWCKDCCHVLPIDFGNGFYCVRPVDGTSPVTGDQMTLGASCKTERVDPTGCGPDGKFWEERS